MPDTLAALWRFQNELKEVIQTIFDFFVHGTRELTLNITLKKIDQKEVFKGGGVAPGGGII